MGQRVTEPRKVLKVGNQAGSSGGGRMCKDTSHRGAAQHTVRRWQWLLDKVAALSRNRADG